MVILIKPSPSETAHRWIVHPEKVRLYFQRAGTRGGRWEIIITQRWERCILRYVHTEVVTPHTACDIVIQGVAARRIKGYMILKQLRIQIKHIFVVLIDSYRVLPTQRNAIMFQHHGS